VTGYQVVDVEQVGNTASVTVELEGLEEGAETTLTLERTGSQKVLFDRWEVVEGGLARELYVSVPEGTESLSVNGTVIDAPSEGGEVVFWALPGTYTVNPFAGSRWVTADEASTVVSAEQYSSAYAESPEPQPSDEFWTEVDAAMDTYLEGCMASTELEPDDCPQSTYAWYDDIRNVEWELLSRPELSASYWDGTFPVDLSTDVEGEARVTYEGRDRFFSDGWEAEKETTTLYLDAQVDLVGDELDVSFSSY
jgi:hypothetical protein